MEKYSEVAKSDVTVAYHQFLYGKRSDERTKWLRDLTSSMPITTVKEKDECMAVYVDDLSLPDIGEARDRYEDNQIHHMYECFLMLTILLGVANKAVSDLAISENGSSKLDRFAKSMSMYNSADAPSISSIGELIAAMEQSKEYCREQIKRRAADPNYEINIDGLYFWPSDIDVCMEDFAYDVLGSERRMIIILDFLDDTIPDRLMPEVNNIVTMRTFYWLKLAVEVDQWKNYWASRGRPVQDIHDYTTVDLDGSYEKSCDAITRKYSFNF